MAGIYLHIPFCKRRCIYCDFFSTTENEKKEAYIQALVKELELRKDYLSGEAIDTIYFGGVPLPNWKQKILPCCSTIYIRYIL